MEAKPNYLVKIYKDEQRLQIIPVIRHFGGYSVDSDWFQVIHDMADYASIGKGIFDAVDVIKRSPVSQETPKERMEKAAWKKGTKLRSWKKFWRYNYFSWFRIHENGEYKVYSTEKNLIDGKMFYNGSVKEMRLPSTATAEEIGKAVVDVLKAAEEFYADNPMR